MSYQSPQYQQAPQYNPQYQQAPQYNQQPQYYAQQPPQYGQPIAAQPVQWPPQQQPVQQLAYPAQQANPAHGQSHPVRCHKCNTVYNLPAGSPSFRCRQCGEMNGSGFSDGFCCFCTIL